MADFILKDDDEGEDRVGKQRPYQPVDGAQLGYVRTIKCQRYTRHPNQDRHRAGSADERQKLEMSTATSRMSMMSPIDMCGTCPMKWGIIFIAAIYSNALE